MNSCRRMMSLFVVAMICMAPAIAVGAQPVPASPEPGTASIGILAEFDVDELPSPHTEVWFLRFQLEPEGSIPEGSNAGPTVIYVESGTLVIQANDPVIAVDGGEADAGEFSLEAGESLMIPAGVETTALNTSDSPVIYLEVLMYSAMDEMQGEGDTAEPVGLLVAGVSVGTAEFDPMPATLTIERVVVEPGEELTGETSGPEGMPPGFMGMDLGTIETGSADVEFQQVSFDALIWQDLSMEQGTGPQQIPLIGSTSIEAGQSYSAFGMVTTFTNTGDEPVTILRVVITPDFGEFGG